MHFKILYCVMDEGLDDEGLPSYLSRYCVMDEGLQLCNGVKACHWMKAARSFIVFWRLVNILYCVMDEGLSRYFIV